MLLNGEGKYIILFVESLSLGMSTIKASSIDSLIHHRYKINRSNIKLPLLYLSDGNKKVASRTMKVKRAFVKTKENVWRQNKDYVG